MRRAQTGEKPASESRFDANRNGYHEHMESGKLADRDAKNMASIPVNRAPRVGR
jgi:hypothetical protein